MIFDLVYWIIMFAWFPWMGVICWRALCELWELMPWVERKQERAAKLRAKIENRHYSHWEYR